jgi:hypothetical protein
MNHLQGLLEDRRGSTAILTALSLALVLGFVALGIEAARGLQVQRALQAAADSGARAGVLAIRAGAIDPVAEARDIAQAIAPAADADAEIHWPPAEGAYQGDLSALEMVLSRSRSPILGSFIGDSGGIVAVRAVARLQAGPEACLLALRPAAGSISVPRPADLRLDNCGMIHAGDAVPPLRLAEADPYRRRLLPQPAGCTGNALVVSGSLAIPSGQSAVFCNGLTIAAGGTVQLGPGLHVVDGGLLTVMPGGTLVADRATILLRGTGGRQQASINVQNGARVTLIAPSTGPGAGLALVAARKAPLAMGLTSLFLNVTGAIHAPDNSLIFHGNSGGGCAQLVADTILISGYSRFSTGCQATGMLPIVDRIALLAE